MHKKVLSIIKFFFIVFFIPSCFVAHRETNKDIRQQILGLIYQKEFENLGVTSSYLSSEEKKELLSTINDKELEWRLQQIKESLEGYSKLVDDIESKKESCITKKNLNKYKNTGWEHRKIGFPNWITIMNRGLLLNKANNLKNQIYLLKLINHRDKNLSNLIEEKQKEYENTINELKIFLSEEKWVD